MIKISFVAYFVGCKFLRVKKIFYQYPECRLRFLTLRIKETFNIMFWKCVEELIKERFSLHATWPVFCTVKNPFWQNYTKNLMHQGRTFFCEIMVTINVKKITLAHFWKHCLGCHTIYYITKTWHTTDLKHLSLNKTQHKYFQTKYFTWVQRGKRVFIM